MKQLNVKQKILYSIILGLFCSMVSFAQNAYEITGIVTADDGAPLPGVNVLEVGTQNGVATDFDGNFIINVSKGSTLKFEYIGFATQNVPVTGQKTINITMAQDTESLADVVVIGYGSRKKSDVTGAVASVKAEELTAFPVLDAAQALQGRAAGVDVQSNNGGEPGAPISIRIRGNTSIRASSDPLVVVDGFIGGSFPQANDIQSIEVLKDASSTAIYGSRGANGVIIVTTKKGKSGKLSIELNSSYAVQRITDELDLLNAEQFSEFTGIAETGVDTDWQDLVYKSGNTTNHNLSFSGGTDKSNFYASGTYFKQEGAVINSEFERLSFLTNIDSQVSNKLKVGLNLFGSRGAQDGVSSQTEGAPGGGDGVIPLLLRFSPGLGVFDENGDFTQNTIGDVVDNPYAVATQITERTVTDRFRANFYANYDITKKLSFKTTFGFSTENKIRRKFTPSTLLNLTGGTSEAIIDTDVTRELLTEQYLTYKTKIGKGDLTLLGGLSYQVERSDDHQVTGEGISADNLLFNNLQAASITTATSSVGEGEIQSQFARANYDYDDRYLLTATLRRDVSSSFPGGEQEGYFPSAALGWKVSNESFFPENSFINSLKFRGSYGVVGNEDVPPNEFLATVAPQQVITGGEISVATVPDQPANDTFNWETSYHTNIGVDFSMFNNRINVTADYYNIDTEDLILPNLRVTNFTGFEDLGLSNIGEINNKGFELTINSNNISNDKFRWTTDLNVSVNKTEVVKLAGDGEDVFFNSGPSFISGLGETNLLRVGETPGAFYGFDFQGVFDGVNTPAGTALREDDDTAGSPLFLDLDGNGVIDTDDRTVIGDPNPDFTFGITNNFVYGNFDLNIFFQGSVGGDIYNLTALQSHTGTGNATTDVLDAYSPTNTDSNIPTIAGRRISSSQFIEDGTYIRLKNLALGYNLPSDISDNLGLGRVRFSVSAQNVFTITDYSGLDPEVNFVGSNGSDNAREAANTTRGFDFGNFPAIRTFNLSVNVKF